MAGNGSTALAKAVKGEEISDKAAKNALDVAIGKLGNLKEKAAEYKANAAHTAISVVNVGETQALCFVGSMAEGVAGAEHNKKVRIGRGVLALGALGWGLYDAITEGKGSHQLSVANGLIASEVASLGLQAGNAWREKRAETQPQAAAEQQAQTAAAAPAQIPADMAVTTPAVAGIREAHAAQAAKQVAELSGQRFRRFAN